MTKARQNNARKGITGILLYRDGNFLQSIEGEEAAVGELFSIIARDKRHNGLMVLFREEIPAREYPDWSMAFRDLSREEEGIAAGYNDLLNANWSKADLSRHSAKVRAFMRMFANQ